VPGSRHPSASGPALAVFLALVLAASGAAPALAAPTWLSPIPIGPAVAGSSDGGMVLVTDSHGFTTLAYRYVINAPGLSSVRIAVRPPGGSFSAPVAVTPETGSAPTPMVEEPGSSLAVDGSDGVWMAWAQWDGSNFRVQVAGKPAGTSTFGAAQTLSNAGVDADPPDVAAGADGTVVVTWTRNGVVQAAVKPPGTTVFSVLPDIDPSDDTDAHVAVDAHGNALVAWAHFVPGIGYGYAIEAAARPAGGSFGTVDHVTSFGNAFDLAIAIDPTGRVTAVWSQDGAIASSERGVTPSFAAAGFGPPEPAQSSAGHATNPSVAVDAAGRAYAAWLAFDNGVGFDVIQTSARPVGGAFSPEQTISGSGEAHAPIIGVSPQGTVVAVWSGQTGNFLDAVQTAFRAPGASSFGGVTNLAISDFANNDEELADSPPPLAFDPPGDALTGWEHQFSTDGGSTYQEQPVVDALDTAGPDLGPVSVPGAATAGDTVSFSVSPFDMWSAHSTSWSFGDGKSASGDGVAHAYDLAGTYAVTVTSTDAVGNATSAARTIQVAPKPPPPPPTPRITSAIKNVWLVKGASITALTLTAANVPAGSTITMRCKGRHCRFKRKKIRVKKTGKVDLAKALGRRNRRFRAKQRLDIRITHPGWIGKDVVFKFKAGKIPSGSSACLLPGASKPSKC
jgi:hypothetical protein